jgi:hypothetical protein
MDIDEWFFKHVDRDLRTYIETGGGYLPGGYPSPIFDWRLPPVTSDEQLRCANGLGILHNLALLKLALMSLYKNCGNFSFDNKCSRFKKAMTILDETYDILAKKIIDGGLTNRVPNYLDEPEIQRESVRIEDGSWMLGSADHVSYGILTVVDAFHYLPVTLELCHISVKKRPEVINLQDEWGQTLLMRAIILDMGQEIVKRITTPVSNILDPSFTLIAKQYKTSLTAGDMAVGTKYSNILKRSANYDAKIAKINFGFLQLFKSDKGLDAAKKTYDEWLKWHNPLYRKFSSPNFIPRTVKSRKIEEEEKLHPVLLEEDPKEKVVVFNSEIKVEDPVMLEEVPILDYLSEDKDNCLFSTKDGRFYPFSKSRLEASLEEGNGVFVGCKETTGFTSLSNRYKDLILFKANSISLLHLDGYILVKDLKKIENEQVFIVIPTKHSVPSVVSESVLRGGGFVSAFHCNDGSGGKIYRLAPAIIKEDKDMDEISEMLEGTTFRIKKRSAFRKRSGNKKRTVRKGSRVMRKKVSSKIKSESRNKRNSSSSGIRKKYRKSLKKGSRRLLKKSSGVRRMSRKKSKKGSRVICRGNYCMKKTI